MHNYAVLALFFFSAAFMESKFRCNFTTDAVVDSLRVRECTVSLTS